MLPTTYLFVPADRPDRFAKALASGADRIIIDLEDALRPQAKEAGRRAVAAASIDWTRVVVRVNDINSPWWPADLDTLAAVPAAAVMIPKAEAPETLSVARTAIGREVEIIPQIETARGLAALDRLLVSPGIARVAFGHLDFAADLGCAPEWEALLLARATLVMQSRLASRAAPIDSVTPDIEADQALLHDTDAARRLGFGGKLLVHPRQVETVRRVFMPSAEDLAWARRVIAADAAAASGVLKVDGHMVDKPVVEAARLILRRQGHS